MSSKIKVDTIENVAGSGNVSLGSGHNLVVPGNITGQGTTTLTGNLTVDTNTFHVDTSNNRVGIGTTSAFEPLRVQADTDTDFSIGSAVTNTALTLKNSTAGANNPVSLALSTESNGEVYLSAVQNSGNTAADFKISQRNGGSRATNFELTAAGYMKKPNQPVFSISGGPNSYQDGSGNQTVVLHGQSGVFPGDMNIGGHFSYSNGRFTAPVAGNYMFTYTLSSGDTNSHFIELRKNNASQTTVLLYATQYQSGCHATIYTLAANDYITAQRRSSSYNVYSAIFSGFLLS